MEEIINAKYNRQGYIRIQYRIKNILGNRLKKIILHGSYA